MVKQMFRFFPILICFENKGIQMTLNSPNIHPDLHEEIFDFHILFLYQLAKSSFHLEPFLHPYLQTCDSSVVFLLYMFTPATPLLVDSKVAC